MEIILSNIVYIYISHIYTSFPFHSITILLIDENNRVVAISIFSFQYFLYPPEV